MKLSRLTQILALAATTLLIISFIDSFIYQASPIDSKFIQELIPRDKHLSVATPISYPFTPYGWNDDYFKKVAPYVNQIAVMSYDSFLSKPENLEGVALFADYTTNEKEWALFDEVLRK